MISVHVVSLAFITMTVLGRVYFQFWKEQKKGNCFLIWNWDNYIYVWKFCFCVAISLVSVCRFYCMALKVDLLEVHQTEFQKYMRNIKSIHVLSMYITLCNYRVIMLTISGSFMQLVSWSLCVTPWHLFTNNCPYIWSVNILLSPLSH